MKAFPTVKSFTAVVIFLFSVCGWGQSAKESRAAAREECETSCGKNLTKYRTSCSNTATDEKVVSTCAENRLSSCVDSCVGDARKDADACITRLDNFRKEEAKVTDQCGLAGIDNVRECRQKAAECSGITDIVGAGEKEEDENGIMRTLSSLFGIGANASSGQSADACTIEDDEKGEAQSEKWSEKVSRLREAIATIKEDAAKADNDVAKEKEKVEEEISKLTEDITEKRKKIKDEALDDAAKSQKAALDLIREKLDLSRKITTSDQTINAIRLRQREEAIRFAQSALMQACGDQAIELKEKRIQEALKKNSGTAATGNIKADVEKFAAQCIKLAAVKKDEALSQTRNALVMEKGKIEDAQQQLKLKTTDAANAVKNLKERSALADDSVKKAEELMAKKIGDLNNKVINIQKLVDEKKASYQLKIDAKTTEINETLFKMQNKKPKFKKVFSGIQSSGKLAKGFVNQCCPKRTKVAGKSTFVSKVDPALEGACNELQTDYDEDIRGVKRDKEKSAN